MFLSSKSLIFMKQLLKRGNEACVFIMKKMKKIKNPQPGIQAGLHLFTHVTICLKVWPRNFL